MSGVPTPSIICRHIQGLVPLTARGSVAFTSLAAESTATGGRDKVVQTDLSENDLGEAVNISLPPMALANENLVCPQIPAVPLCWPPTSSTPVPTDHHMGERI